MRTLPFPEIFFSLRSKQISTLPQGGFAYLTESNSIFCAGFAIFVQARISSEPAVERRFFVRIVRCLPNCHDGCARRPAVLSGHHKVQHSSYTKRLECGRLRVLCWVHISRCTRSVIMLWNAERAKLSEDR
jgi:hypothetical protein